MKRAMLLSTLIATGLMLAPAAFAQEKGAAMSPMAHDSKMSDGMKPANATTKSDDKKMQKSDGMSKADGMKDSTKTNTMSGNK